MSCSTSSTAILILVLDEPDQLHQFDLLGRVHAGRGFVEQQQLRPCGQCADNFQAPLVAVRQALGRLVAERASSWKISSISITCVRDLLFLVQKRAPAAQRVGDAVLEMQMERHAHVVEHAQRRKQPDVLKRPGDAAAVI